jgi:hypothetical protein
VVELGDGMAPNVSETLSGPEDIGSSQTQSSAGNTAYWFAIAQTLGTLGRARSYLAALLQAGTFLEARKHALKLVVDFGVIVRCEKSGALFFGSLLAFEILRSNAGRSR